MNETAFFAALRRSVFKAGGITQGQVDGIEAVLRAAAEWQVADGRRVANILAQVYHETGGQMLPVKETVYASSKDRNPSDAEVIRRLDASFAKGQLTWVKTPYWRDGWFGRGMIQITHETNYAKAGRALGVDLLGNRDLALEIDISAAIAVVGMLDGIFTGKRLADFFGAGRDDPAGARAIVNGDGKAVGPKIAELHRGFLAAIDAGGGWALPVAKPEPAAAPSLEERVTQLEVEMATLKMTMIGEGR